MGGREYRWSGGVPVWTTGKPEEGFTWRVEETANPLGGVAYIRATVQTGPGEGDNKNPSEDYADSPTSDKREEV